MQNTERQMELRTSLYRKVEAFKGRVRDTNTPGAGKITLGQ